MAVVLGCCVVFDLTISVVIFSQALRFCFRFSPHFSHFVATCLASMTTAETQNTWKLLSAVQGGENRAIFMHYMKVGDPMAAMLWAAFRIR